MASKVDWSPLHGYKKDCSQKNLTGCQNSAFPERENLVTVEATCPTGFEMALESEIKEKFASVVKVKHQGRIFFDLPVSEVEDAIQLRCADNLYVIIGVRNHFDFSGDADACFARINSLLNDEIVNCEGLPLAWEKGIIAWNKISKFKNIDEHEWESCLSMLKVKNTARINASRPDLVPKDPIDIEDNAKVLGTEKDFKLPTFRATCYRSGKNVHPFGSNDVASSFGGAINEKFGWKASMKDFELEVVITIDVDQLYVGIGLNKISLFKRNITHFGPTTLRATICAGMLRLANIQPGDIVVDPLCGGASITIEGALAFDNGFHIGGDIHEKAVKRSIDNLNSLSKVLSQRDYMPVSKHVAGDVLQWDVTKIPMRDNSVDVFVSDLPFGKRSGSKADNRYFYTKIMQSMARVVKPQTGRAVLLTQDKTSMFKAQGKFNQFWKINRQIYCNIGGLSALVFVMSRTDVLP